MSPRRFRNLVRLLIAALLFAQGALALAACDWVRRAPALAVSQAGEGGAGCMERMRNVNLCVGHCLGEEQSLDKPSIPMPALAAAPGFVLHGISLASHQRARAAALFPTAIRPPLRIRFQSFLL